MKKKKGFPHTLTGPQRNRYIDMQKAEVYPGGLNIRAGNEMGFRTVDKRVLPGADPKGSYGVRIRNQRA